MGKQREGRVWKNLWTALETGEVILPVPEGCVFLTDSPSPLQFPTMRFLALGTSAENPAGSLEKSYGNPTTGVACAAPRVGREAACVPETGIPRRGERHPNLGQLHPD